MPYNLNHLLFKVLLWQYIYSNKFCWKKKKKKKKRFHLKKLHSLLNNFHLLVLLLFCYYHRYHTIQHTGISRKKYDEKNQKNILQYSFKIYIFHGVFTREQIRNCDSDIWITNCTHLRKKTLPSLQFSIPEQGEEAWLVSVFFWHAACYFICDRISIRKCTVYRRKWLEGHVVPTAVSQIKT